MDYKSRLTNLKLLPLMYIYELTEILFAIKSFKNIQMVLIYPNFYNVMNQQLDLLTPSYVTRYTATLSQLTLIFVGYPADYGMHYQS